MGGLDPDAAILLGEIQVPSGGRLLGRDVTKWGGHQFRSQRAKHERSPDRSGIPDTL
jgi:hypothetical protein